MSLENLNHEERILFLLKFAGEMVINSAESENLKNKIIAAKIKAKYLDNKDTDNEIKMPLIFYSKESDSSSSDNSEYKKSSFFNDKKIKNRFFRKLAPNKINHKPTMAAGNKTTQNINEIKKIPPMGDPFRLLDPLLNDDSIQMVECPGPGKNLLVKVKNRINVTKIVFGKEDIDEVIRNYSEKARIPIIGGMLKAALGDLMISAVVSRYVGSRFIITKRSPYSIIEGYQTKFK